MLPPSLHINSLPQRHHVQHVAVGVQKGACDAGIRYADSVSSVAHLSTMQDGVFRVMCVKPEVWGLIIGIWGLGFGNYCRQA